MRTVIRLKILANLIEREIRTSSAIENMIKMTNMHGRIISYLHRNEGRDIYQRDIEKTFMISGPSVSEVLKLMQKNGLIERQSVKHDARLKKIVLTDKAGNWTPKYSSRWTPSKTRWRPCFPRRSLPLLKRRWKN